MKASVIICTRNRAQSLDRTLRSLTLMRKPAEGEWEIILVDNGSTDATPQVVASYESRLPIRRVVETTPGLSNARNKGVDEAKGDFIAWTDDDVEVNEDWLSAYLEAIETNPNAVVLGGKIIPSLDEPSTDWFRRNLNRLGELAAHRDFGDQPLRLAPADGIEPFGANFAIRLSTQRKFRYDPNLGVEPGNERRGEEIDVISRALANGGEGIWVPKSQVKHYITQARQTESYVQAYYTSQGHSIALNEYDSKAITVFGGPASIWLKAWIYGAGRKLLRPLSEGLWVRSMIGHSVQTARLRVWRAGGKIPAA